MRFDTLSESLAFERVQHWPVHGYIPYGHTGRAVINGRAVSVTRFDDGTYEEPICYRSECDNQFSVISSGA